MLTARERIDRLLDPGTFVELNMFARQHCSAFDMSRRDIPGEGIITGYGEVDGRPVFLYSQDFSAMSGTLGKWGGRKVAKIMDLAYEKGAPIVGINQSLGARLQEMAHGELGSVVGFADLFHRHAIYSGSVPQISLMMGDNAGGQVYGPGQTDFLIATRAANMFIAGPALVKSVMGEDISSEQLGGAAMHASVSGAVHVLADDDVDCIARARALLGYLPSDWRSTAPVTKAEDPPDRMCTELDSVLPDNSHAPYDMHRIIEAIVDDHVFYEIHRGYARSVVLGFARFAGHSTGILATNPMVLAGALDVKAAEKAARFVYFCDAFSIPLVFLQDTPAFLVGSEQERAGMIYRGAALISATSQATVPMVTVIVRKGQGGAYVAMGSNLVGADICYAWPSADMTGLQPTAIADILYRNQIVEAADPVSFRANKVEQCRQELGDIYSVASWQHLDDIIEPRETRRAIIQGLKMTRGKRSFVILETGRAVGFMAVSRSVFVVMNRMIGG